MKNESLKGSILILDDDHTVLQLLKINFLRIGLEVYDFDNVVDAKAFLNTDSNKLKVKIAIIDLFLDGDSGDHLSNNFIRDELIPSNIDYCRLTSAPCLVPPQFGGLGVFDKQEELRDINSFFDSLTALVD